MFEDSLIESGGRLKTKRGATTLFSFVLQMILLGVLILIPLLYTEALPKTQLMTFLVAPPPPPPPPPPAAATPIKVVKIQSEIVNGQLRTPTKIPQKIQMIKEEEAPPPMNSMAGVVGGVPGGVPGGIGPTGPAEPPPPPPEEKKPEPPKIIRKSGGVLQGSATRKVEPTYPPLAKAARVNGQVVVEVTVDEQGNVISARALNGHPLLKDAAVNAAKGWKFSPTMLTGVPVKVIGTITFNFNL